MSMQLLLIFWQHIWGQAWSCLPCHLPYTLHKRLGTDVVTLSIKYSAIVVETMKSVIDPDIDVIINSEYRQIQG